MGYTQKLGLLAQSVFQDSSLNVGIGAAPSGSYKLEVTGTAKVSSTLLVSGAATFSGFVGINGSPATAFPLEAYINSSTAYTTSSRGNVMRVYNSNTTANVFAGIELVAEGTGNGGVAGINAVVTGSGSAALTFYTRDSNTFAERMRITSAGNVGIGTSSPQAISGYVGLTLNGTDGSFSYYRVNTTNIGRFLADGANFYMDNLSTSGSLIFTTNNTTERMRITSDGTLLIGGASASGAYNCSLGNATANTYYQVRSANTNSLFGADSRGTWFGNLSSKEIYANGSNLNPGVDNSTTLGSSSYRWSVVYAVNGSIQTSDERQKTDIFTSDLGLDFINKLNPVSYKWKVGGNDVEYSSVEDENGNLTPTSVATPKVGIRTHYGLIAQQVKEVLGNKDFGGFVHDKETDMMSLRYDQFISPLIKAIQELNERLNKAGL